MSVRFCLYASVHFVFPSGAVIFPLKGHSKPNPISIKVHTDYFPGFFPRKVENWCPKLGFSNNNDCAIWSENFSPTYNLDLKPNFTQMYQVQPLKALSDVIKSISEMLNLNSLLPFYLGF